MSEQQSNKTDEPESGSASVSKPGLWKQVIHFLSDNAGLVALAGVVSVAGLLIMNAASPITLWHPVLQLLLVILIVVSFGAAYRWFIKFSADPKADDMVRLMRMQRYFERNAGWWLFLSVAVAAALYGLLGSAGSGLGAKVLTFVIALLVFAAVLSTITVFTRTLNNKILRDANERDEDSALNVLFRVGYLFVASVITFVVLNLIDPSLFNAALSAGEQRGPSDRVYRLIAIVEGCDFSNIPAAPLEGNELERETLDRLRSNSDSPAGDQRELLDFLSQLYERRSVIPYGSYCKDIPPQWVVSIGGSILKCHIDGTCYDTRPPIWSPDYDPARVDDLAVLPAQQQECPLPDCADPETALKDAKDLRNKLQRTKSGLELLQDSTRIAKLFGGAETSSQARQVGARLLDIGLELEVVNAKIAAISPIAQQSAAKKKIAYHVPGQPITGGIVIPVYFLAIALLGACVSMLRKLPEYHHRSTEAYRQRYAASLPSLHPNDRPVSPGQARDYIVFQSVQVVFAPIIAILAWSWVHPLQIGVAVLLAFAAGYASEIFLIAIRELSDRLIGIGMDSRSDPAVPVSRDQQAQSGTFASWTTGQSVRLRSPLGTFGVGGLGEIVALQGTDIVVRGVQDEFGHFRTELFPARSADFFEAVERV